ncbi:MAG: ABC transporter substrate-binding protein, partial [Clostridia bacterium]|nr:ABC transporter substrate-binding protein [Clostridia bacterium]
MMKTTFKIIILTLCLAFLVSCIGREPIKIGFMGTVSGSSNDLGLNALHGLDIAVQKINDGGGINGRPIEVVVKDTMNDKTLAKRVVDEFIEEDIDIVIGEFTSSMMETVLEYDTRQKIL